MPHSQVDIVVGVIVVKDRLAVKAAAALAASSRFSAAFAAAVEREKSATIKKYEATAAMVCWNEKQSNGMVQNHYTYIRYAGIGYDKQIKTGEANGWTTHTMQECGHLL